MNSDLADPSDIQTIIEINLNGKSNRYQKYILELDIKKCFDRINQNKLMWLLRLAQNIKKFLLSVLKTELLNERSETSGVIAKSDVISPLLCNI